MDTSRGALLNLLELQKVDTAIDRAAARCANLPEQAALDDLEAQLAENTDQLAKRQAALDEVAIRQKRLDFEVDSVGRKIEIESNRLYSGIVNNAKELSDLSREVEALKRRKIFLEDSDIAVMEEREMVEGELKELQEEHNSLVAGIEQARAARDVAAGEVGNQLSAAQADRDRWVPKLDPELLRLYNNIRASRGGVGAAAMIDDVCQGCHMRLPAQEAARVRAAQGLVRCDDCQRILVIL